MRRLDFKPKEMIREINQLDTYCGLNLKKMKHTIDTSELYQITQSKTQMYMARLMAAVNAIDTSEYFARCDNMGLVSAPVGIHDPVFIEYSSLEWAQNKKYDLNSMIFKCRFLSQLLYYSMGYLDQQSNCRFYTRNIKIDPDAHKYFYVKEIAKDARSLCVNMLCERDYHNSLMINLFNSNYCIKKSGYKKAQRIEAVNKQINMAVNEIRDNMGIFKVFQSDYSDDMAIYTIMRIAYMAATKSNNFKFLPTFGNIEGASVENDLILVIHRLGEAIIREFERKGCPIMFMAFNEANPNILTNYKDINDDSNLIVGVRALVFADFIIGDRKIHKFITKMYNHQKEVLN